MNDSFDAIIIGAGPAGLAAASVLAQHQISACLIDEQIGPGGQIWRNTSPAHQWPGISYNPVSSVIDITTQGTVNVTWLQHTSDGKVMRESRAQALIIASGAMERPLLFPGAQLPGVMGIGAVQTVLKQAGLIPQGPGVVLAGQGPLLLLTIQQLLDKGATIDAVLDLSVPGARRNAAKWLSGALMSDSSLLMQGMQLMHQLRSSGITVWKNVTSLQASGSHCVEQVQFTSNGRQIKLAARLLAVHDGVLPNTQLTRLLNLEHRWNDSQQSFAPVTQTDGQSSHPQIWIAGDGAGIAGADLAVQRGRLTGLAVARALRPASKSMAIRRFDDNARRLAHGISQRLPARHLIDALYTPLPVDHLATADTIVCRCEAITLSTVRSAISRGATGPNRIKTFTRCGMGACQGRQCGTHLTRLLAQTTDQSVDSIGALRIRPPLKPTLIADYLNMGKGSSRTQEAG